MGLVGASTCGTDKGGGGSLRSWPCHQGGCLLGGWGPQLTGRIRGDLSSATYVMLRGSEIWGECLLRPHLLMGMRSDANRPHKCGKLNSCSHPDQPTVPSELMSWALQPHTHTSGCRGQDRVQSSFTDGGRWRGRRGRAWVCNFHHTLMTGSVTTPTHTDYGVCNSLHTLMIT